MYLSTLVLKYLATLQSGESEETV